MSTLKNKIRNDNLCQWILYVWAGPDIQLSPTKGQLISKEIFDAINLNKKTTIFLILKRGQIIKIKALYITN